MHPSQSLGQAVLWYQGRYYPLNKQRIVIGSDQRCDIRIENNQHVLPMHVQVISEAGQVFLQYMERGAAIWVNGSPASEQLLRDRDEIAVGDRNMLLNRNLAGADQQAMGTSTGAVQTVGGTQVLASPQPLPPASPGQMPPTIATTPVVGTAQMSGAIAAMPQPYTSMPAKGGKATDTTRYLCAAGHLDEDFQDYVMHHVIYEERRALGESYGVDMPAVVSWCKSGLQRINARDWLLTILLAVAFFGNFLLIAILNTLLAGTSLYSRFSILEGGLQFFGVVTIILSLIILPIAFNVERWVRRRWTNSHPGIITYLVLFIPFGLLGFILVPLVWLTIFVELILRYYGEPTKRLRKNAFNPQARPVPLDANLERKLYESFVTGQRNVVAYSGYRPFAGAGYYKGGWSFVVDTSKGAYDTSNITSSTNRLTPQPFTVSSLYDAVEKDVWALGIKNVLEIEGKLYVHGQYLPENPPFFDSAAIRPVTGVYPGLVEQYKEHPTEDVRYYQCLRFNFWRGEMVFTAFLRFVQRGKELFTEIDYLLLPPMKPKYYWVDEREATPLLIKIWQLYKLSFDDPIQKWLCAPIRLLRGFRYGLEQRWLARFAPANPAFDYGAFTSVRQRASDDEYHLFFQKLDEEMYLKVIEKQILETIINFLNARQIDTTELRQREQMILNNNTINSNTFNNSGSGTFNNAGIIGNVTGGQINTTQSAANAQSTKIDVLLVTVTETETRAIWKIFSGIQKHFIGDKTYYELDEVNSTKVYLVQSEMGMGGAGGAIRTIEKGIELLSPSAVIMVGIAFGVDPVKQQIGDILVSERILDYELQRVGQINTDMVIIPRGDKVSVSSRLLNRCRDGAMEWQEANEAGKVQFGLILSGAKLVDNRHFREQLRSFAPEAIGGEMEGAGLYAAAHGNKVDWILVKAISDWADGNKAENKQVSQELAAARAARFVFHVINQGGLRGARPKL